MKRIITLLMAILFAQSTIGQIPNTMEQAFEKTKTNIKSKLQEKRLKDKRLQNIAADYNTPTLNRVSSIDLKTLDSLVGNEWDEDLNIWKPYIKEVFTYNSEDRSEESLFYLWNALTSSWQLFLKEEYTFDTNGLLLTNIRSNQLMPNIWVLDEKTEYTYNSSGNLILEINASWDSINNIWVNANKHEVTYDSSQNRVLDLGYDWTANQWVNSYKDEFLYSMGVVSFEFNSLWNDSTNQYDLISKWEYFYDTLALTLETLFKWNTDSSIWVNDYKYEYEYDLGMVSSLVLIKETGSVWNSSMNQWEPQYKDEYETDSNDNHTLGVYSEWVGTPTSGTWVPYYKDEFVYDLNFSLSDLILPYIGDIDLDELFISLHNMIIGYFGFNYSNMAWVDNVNILFYYSDYNNPLGINHYAFKNAVKVYPNPTYDFLTINSEITIDKAVIYTISGKKVKEIHSSFNAIPVYDMADGLYLLKIQSDNNTVFKKIIIK